MRSPSHLVALLLLAFPPAVLAQTDAQTASLARTLKGGKIAAHRVVAARTLGDSEDPEAVGPLCAGLQDEDAEVRVSAAEALGKLQQPEGMACLEARTEEPGAVRTALDAALKSLRALKARPPRMYVQLRELKDTTGSVPPELLRLTEARLRRKLFLMGAVLAPQKESDAAAKEALHKQKLPGYELRTEIVLGPREG